MKKILFIIVLNILFGTIAVFAEPMVLKSTLDVRAYRTLRYWKFDAQDNYWSWMPVVEFQGYGEIPNASFITFEFSTPDGKFWFKEDVNMPAVPEGQVWAVSSPEADTHSDKRTTTLTGTFPFKVTLKNGLQGTEKLLYAGSYTVGKYHVGNSLPAFKNQFEFYVNQDWNLPIGYLYLNYLENKEAPALNAMMWFRGELDQTKIGAYLYYNGKQIASTTALSGASKSKTLFAAEGTDDYCWERWLFTFGNVRGYLSKNASDSYSNAHFLSVNPGNYEIKVLYDGELSRTASFTVGKDGLIVDNGIAASNKVGGISMIMPVKILGNKDYGWNVNAWKTEAFYGNPLTGFSVQ